MNENRDIRILILNCIMIIIGVIFVIQLFNLQIVNGEEYRLEAQERVVRKRQVAAPRGEILDRYGEILATNREGFNVMLYKTRLENSERNEMLLKMVQVLNKWNTPYRDTFPILVNPFSFDLEDEESILKWKKRNNFNENETAEEIFYKYIKKYEIDDKYTLEEKRIIVAMRYEIEMSGYSSYTAYEVATDVGKEVISEITERSDEFPGLAVEIQPIRTYPNNNLASHILGYIGKISSEKYAELKDSGYSMNDNIGKDGIENVMEHYLKGKNAAQKIEVDELGRYVMTGSNSNVIAGAQVYLTIDSKLQEVTEKALKENIEKIASGAYTDGSEQAKSGAVVAIDVNTGEILAMASYPDYDPNVFVKGVSNTEWKELNNESKPMFNRNILGLYSPGSIFKMVVAVAALETGVIDENTIIKDEGIYTNYTNPQPKCWIWSPSTQRTHGEINVADAIKYSCNYFFYKISEDLGIEKIEEYSKLFGLGEKTGIELPGEKKGIVAGKTYAETINKKWMPGHTLSAAIGQSDNTFTPIQIARYIAILANGGTRIKPHIIKNVINSDGTEVSGEELTKYFEEALGVTTDDEYPNKIDISETTLKEVFKGMESVTGDSGGTAYSTFKDFPVKVAGKTGTVQVGSKDDNAWFLGFAPYDNPEIAICAVIEQGSHGTYTAPIIKAILEEYFVIKEESENIDTNMILTNNELQ